MNIPSYESLVKVAQKQIGRLETGTHERGMIFRERMMGQRLSGTQAGAITFSVCGASVMADKKAEHTAHLVTSKIAKALLKVKPASGKTTNEPCV
jgi:hypothetical protein